MPGPEKPLRVQSPRHISSSLGSNAPVKGSVFFNLFKMGKTSALQGWAAGAEVISFSSAQAGSRLWGESFPLTVRLRMSRPSHFVVPALCWRPSRLEPTRAPRRATFWQGSLPPILAKWTNVGPCGAGGTGG